MIKKISLILICFTILSVNALRFWQLDSVPYGFNVDELSGAVTMQCLGTEGVDAHLNPYPLFCELNYGTPKPPLYAYPAMLWQKTFGYTADNLRAFTAFFTLLSIVGLFCLGTLMFNSTYGLLAALIASISPWAWPLSRIGYESTFCAFFIIGGLFFFLRSQKCADKIFAGLFFACALYVYPPMRVQIPLLIITLLIVGIHRQGWHTKAMGLFSLAILIPCIPLIQQLIFGNIQQRFKGISIFADDYLKLIGKSHSFVDLAQVFLNNYAAHFSASFLFLKGDPSSIHSTQHMGIFGWLDILGLASLVFLLLFRSKELYQHAWWLIFLTVNFFIGFIPTALTNSELPNSLRIIGAWPFACLILSYGLWHLSTRWHVFLLLIASVAITFALISLRTYFVIYPNESKGWFYSWTKDQAMKAKTEQDWANFMMLYPDQDYHFRYYLMNYHGDSCSSSRKKWQNVRALLGYPKVY